MEVAGCQDALATSGDYWDRVLGGWEPSTAHRLWRAHSDAINSQLLKRWLPASCRKLLKTDLFDEAVGGGLYPQLASCAKETLGVDVSTATVRAAQARYPALDGQVANVLSLPFATGTFDVVVSNSTLDHFESAHLLRAALIELTRTLERGGQLILTLDNRENPIVAVRTSGLFKPLHRLGIVPYYVGATHGHRTLSKLLDQVGLEVTDLTAILHCPPQLAAHLTARTRSDTSYRQTEQEHLDRVLRCEALQRWPTRYITGHFVAARATKR